MHEMLNAQPAEKIAGLNHGIIVSSEFSVGESRTFLHGTRPSAVMQLHECKRENHMHSPVHDDVLAIGKSSFACCFTSLAVPNRILHVGQNPGQDCCCCIAVVSVSSSLNDLPGLSRSTAPLNVDAGTEWTCL